MSAQTTTEVPTTTEAPTTTEVPTTTEAPTTTTAPPVQLDQASLGTALYTAHVPFDQCELPAQLIEGDTKKVSCSVENVDGSAGIWVFVVHSNSALSGIEYTEVRPAPTSWEIECPGTLRQVIYNGTSSAPYKYGEMTAAYPGGTTQDSPDLPIHLESDPVPMGDHFCAQPGSFVYISLQNSQDSGDISCSIEVDGILIANIKSYGGYTIASCSGTA